MWSTDRDNNRIMKFNKNELPLHVTRVYMWNKIKVKTVRKKNGNTGKIKLQAHTL